MVVKAPRTGSDMHSSQYIWRLRVSISQPMSDSAPKAVLRPRRALGLIPSCALSRMDLHSSDIAFKIGLPKHDESMHHRSMPTLSDERVSKQRASAAEAYSRKEGVTLARRAGAPRVQAGESRSPSLYLISK